MKKYCIELPEKESYSKYNGLLTLPSDMADGVMLFLDFPDFCQLAYICKQYNSLHHSLRNKKNHIIWRQQYQNMRREIDSVLNHQKLYRCYSWKVSVNKGGALMPYMLFEKDLLQSFLVATIAKDSKERSNEDLSDNSVSIYNLSYLSKVQILYCNTELLIFNLKKQLQYFKEWWINNYSFIESQKEFDNITYGCCCDSMDSRRYNCIDRGSGGCRHNKCAYSVNLSSDVFNEYFDLHKIKPHCIYRDGDVYCHNPSVYSENLRVCLCGEHFNLYKMRKLRLNIIERNDNNGANHNGINGSNDSNDSNDNNGNNENCDKCCCRYYSPIYDSSSSLRFKQLYRPPIVNEPDKLRCIFYKDIYDIIVSYLKVDVYHNRRRKNYYDDVRDYDNYRICEHCGIMGAQAYLAVNFPFPISLHPLYNNPHGYFGYIYLCNGKCAWSFMLRHIDYKDSKDYKDFKNDDSSGTKNNESKFIPIPCVFLRNIFRGGSKELLSSSKSSPFVLTEKCAVIDICDQFCDYNYSTVHQVYSLTHQDYCDGKGCWTYLPRSYIL